MRRLIRWALGWIGAAVAAAALVVVLLMRWLSAQIDGE